MASKKNVQIIQFRGLDLDALEKNLRPVVACEISADIAVQVINIEGLKIEDLGRSLRLVTACEISRDPSGTPK